VLVEFRELKWALVAAQHRSLRRAAETLNIRQSTLSRRLRDLELQLGAVPFERTRGGTKPTAAGQRPAGAGQHAPYHGSVDKTPRLIRCLSRMSEMNHTLSESRRFLVVDDEPIIAMNVADELRDFGYVVVGPATTMEDAKYLAAAGHFDAVLLDLNLHGKNSDSVAEVLVAREIPFALMTGYNEAPPGTFVDIPILRKPFSDAELKRTVDALLEDRLATQPKVDGGADQQHRI
jgi:CheY-like chemotaxis protein